jgi:putative phosphoesterase
MNIGMNAMTDKRVSIGVISDTHGQLRPEAFEALRGSDRILHAGDVGAPEILDALAQIAPVTAIRGNVDTQAWARVLPPTDVVEIEGVVIYMLHDLAQLDLKPEAAGCPVVVYGHSHRPKIEEKNGVYFNPGSAGTRRFSLPISVGRLTVAAGKVKAELIELVSEMDFPAKSGKDKRPA